MRAIYEARGWKRKCDFCQNDFAGKAPMGRLVPENGIWDIAFHPECLRENLEDITRNIV
jgi:hypothetical protein